jgi:hypothetical protein
VAIFSDRNATCTDVFVGEYQKKAINLIARNNFDQHRGISAKRREKLSRLENNILKLVFRPTITHMQDANNQSAVATISRISSASLTHNEQLFIRYSKNIGLVEGLGFHCAQHANNGLIEMDRLNNSWQPVHR